MIGENINWQYQAPFPVQAKFVVEQNFFLQLEIYTLKTRDKALG